MSLFDRCVDLQLKLEVAQSADTSLELLARGTRLVEGLDQASQYFEGAAAFRARAGIAALPGLNVKAVSQAVRGFRAGLSQHGLPALQHQPATTLTEVAKAQRERVARWVIARWKELFAEYEPLLERAHDEHLVGSGTHRVVVQGRAATLRAVRGMDPVLERAELQTRLGGEDVTAWMASARTLGSELREALKALDDERAALTPEIREVLQRAASDGGLPVSALTAELLAALHASGLDEHLVVRRQ